MRKIVYKSETSISTWTYDYSKNTTGPISVEVEYTDLPPEPVKKGKKKTKQE